MAPTSKQRDLRKNILDVAQQRVAETWGRDALDNLGEKIYWALVAEQVLVRAAHQDESISADTVRLIVTEGWDELTDRHYSKNEV